jgi:hypothetical protein
MKPSEYLDLAKKATKAASDNDFARIASWGKSQVNNYRHNRQNMDNEQCRIVSELTGVDLVQIIADMEQLRAEKRGNKEGKRAWARISKMKDQAGNASSKLLINMGIISLVTSVYCILCKITKSEENRKAETVQSIKAVS